MKFSHNPAHPVGTCELCGEEMVYNVPRLGRDGGFVHKATGALTCSAWKQPTTAHGFFQPVTVRDGQIYGGKG